MLLRLTQYVHQLQLTLDTPSGTLLGEVLKLKIRVRGN